MDKDEAYLNCLLEEYRRCKEEIVILQKYQWRVQMFYIPSLLLAILGFYLKEVWSGNSEIAVRLSTIVQNLFADGTFLVIVFWSALMSILAILYTGTVMLREGRYIRERISPALEQLIGGKKVFEWEGIALERLSISKSTDDSLQLYADIGLSTLLSILPTVVAILSAIRGIQVIATMGSFIRWFFYAGVVLAIALLLIAIIGILFFEMRHRKSNKADDTSRRDKGSSEHSRREGPPS